jgi:hypothetical protein
MLRSIGSFAWRVARRPWLGVSVCVLVCSLLAAQAVGHVIEARVLPAAATAPKIPTIAAPAPVAAPVVDRGARGTSLVERDMFCSSCAPVVTPPTPGGTDDPGGVPLTSLPLVLVATSLGHEPVATVRDDRSGSQGAYVIGQELPRAGEITHIGATYVDFVNAETSREERVSLLAAAAAPPKGPDPTATATADAPFADRVRKIDDTTYEVERSLVKELVGSAGKPVAGVRMMPIAKDGKLAGVRVLSARADSVAAALGLKSGDTLGAVNGVAIDSIDKMLEVYTKLDNTNVVAIDGTRGGKPITWQYHLR